MKHLSFFLLALISFVITAAFTGFVAHLIPSPSEFFAVAICAFGLTYIASRLSKYQKWPVVVLWLLLIVVGISSGLIVKKMIHAKTATTVENIRVEEAGKHLRKDFYSFTNSTINFQYGGYYLLEHYGDHHYYAFPVVAENWDIGDPVVVWTWARTRKAKSAEQQKRLIPSMANYGIKVRQQAVKTNVAYAIEQSVEEYGLEVPEKIILLNWGMENSTRQLWPKLRFHFYLFISMLAISMLIQLSLKRRKSQ